MFLLIEYNFEANPPFNPSPSDKPLTFVSTFDSPTFLFPVTPFPERVIVSEPTKLLIVDKSDAATDVVASYTVPRT